jgi:hypothetical protein
MAQGSDRPRFHWSRGDVGVLAVIAVAGLMDWLLYVAAQPRDYALPYGSPHRLDTLFGWRAPGIDPRDVVERDRLLVAIVGWLFIGLVAGRFRQRLWPLVGPAAVLPILLVFFSTAPHDAQGWWVLNVVYLPVIAGVASGAAFMANRLDWLFHNPLLFGGVFGASVASGLLAGGGESSAAVVVVSLASALIACAIVFGTRMRRHST